ncbi:MAG TPA: Type 1 glutamine amidotransferase-like domain-containing protein [Thermomicrobiales bacterium]|jgi:dipeptidase E|nr:Type 1 glutamine amidotransferase-like domain-containing protein [Thermomicrobiales bacterium]
MKLLLASAGIKNRSIHEALVELLGKPVSEASALCIPTASYGQGLPGPGRAWNFTAGQEPECPMVELGWKSMGTLELSVLPSLGEDAWVPLVRETDAILVNGGDPLFLAYWMRASGFATVLPTLPGVYVSLSAGSMVMTPDIGEEFAEWRSPTGGDEPLGLVDFSIFPHLEHKDLPWNTMANAEKWASKLAGPAYAIDDESAIKVTDGGIEVISEGRWHRLDR